MVAVSGESVAVPATGIDRAHRRVIVASSLGTMFEWYDFYLYGSLAAIISKQFFSGVNETTAFIFALLAFAAGFAVRPFGAVIFGRLGDLSGRKKTFLITIVLMGLATALVGVLPSYETIGIAAPIVLVTLRLLQGLAVGGEYGGAATYIAEHAPPGRRAYYTSWIQITATAGMILSLIVILGCRWLMGPEFEVWGWRIPFLLSIILLCISVYIRVQLEESPVFKEMRDTGKLSKQPLRESIGQWSNLKLVLLALLGAMAGQAVIGYVALVYMNLFLTQTLKVDPATSNLLVAAALTAATPFYLLSGKVADKIGRKPQVMLGCLLAAVTMFPIFKGLTDHANPAIATAQASHPIVVMADPAECSLQFDPVGGARFTSSCDVAKTALANARVPYSNEAAPVGMVAIVKVGEQSLVAFDGSTLPAAEFASRSAAFKQQLSALLKDGGYPTSADPDSINYGMVFLLLFILSVLGVMTYGPIAAWLVELFPARIRYTSMSLPYHLGNGWFGGFLPSIAFAMIAYTGNIYSGLWYPVIVCVMTLIVGTFFLRETHGNEAV
ncbi:MFS transporter [Steroidobacter agaridevorans]|uniref:MFS transporter n=1 Tax=Steroidobacter agaridevorans TaxID=2695856 RepID=A0A829Y485_9GAMM|nr:MFS transporter [Steroidobacter agaridevorans]GFE78030.1 MFS transporter [Steroidobacter agaridevorans]